MWVKIWRDSSAHAGRPDYAEYESDRDLSSVIDYYDGLIHDDGRCHRLKWEKVDKPPKEWVKKEIIKYTGRLKTLFLDYEDERESLKKIIKEYNILLKDK